jgi:hypothetical protein
MKNAGIFYGHLEYFTVICIFYDHLIMFWKFGIFHFVLVYCVKKNLASLAATRALKKMQVMIWLAELGRPRPVGKTFFNRTHFSGTKKFIAKFNIIPRLSARPGTGWPDWANFCPLGDCLLLGQFLENCRRSLHFWAAFVLGKVYGLNLTKKLVGLHFGRFFLKTRLVTLARNKKADRGPML